MGKITKQPTKHADQYPIVNDSKLRQSLILLSDVMDEQVRNIIYLTYNDPDLLSIYKGWRDSRDFETGGKSKVYREVIKFPNPYVYDFCKAVFEPEHGIEWVKDKKLWSHELIKPWLLVKTW